MTFPHSPDDKPPACEICDDTGMKLVRIDLDPSTGRLVFTHEDCTCGAKPLVQEPSPEIGLVLEFNETRLTRLVELMSREGLGDMPDEAYIPDLDP